MNEKKKRKIGRRKGKLKRKKRKIGRRKRRKEKRTGWSF